MIDPEHCFVVRDPELLFADGYKNPIMHFQILEETSPGQYGRTGKYIHLEIPNESAMRLLGSLKGYQKHMGLPDPGTAQAKEIPPQTKLN
jgi:hypothetical protein